jgi:hypothetical protein
MSWVVAAMMGCLVGVVVGGLSSTLVWIEIVSQVKKLHPSLPVPEWGHPSFSQVSLAFRVHKLNYPSSRHRIWFWIVTVVSFVSLLAIVLVALGHPRPPSR